MLLPKTDDALPEAALAFSRHIDDATLLYLSLEPGSAGRDMHREVKRQEGLSAARFAIKDRNSDRWHDVPRQPFRLSVDADFIEKDKPIGDRRRPLAPVGLVLNQCV